MATDQRSSASDRVVCRLVSLAPPIHFATVTAEHRRVIAETPAHAQALAQNLALQGFGVEAQTVDEWLLRKKRRRGDVTVRITIRQPDEAGRPLSNPSSRVPPSPWAPPAGPRAG